MKFYFISLLFVLLSCNGQKMTVTENSKLTQESSAMILILQEEYSEFDVVETMVIKDQKRLKSFYSKINRTRKPGLPVPLIDFTEEMIIVHCNGEQNKIGIPTLILEKETDTTMRLISNFESKAKDASTAVMTYPFSVYKMSLTGKEIIIEDGVK